MLAYVLAYDCVSVGGRGVEVGGGVSAGTGNISAGARVVAIE